MNIFRVEKMKSIWYISLTLIALFLYNCDTVTQNNMSALDGNYYPEGGDRYNEIEENPFVEVSVEPISTFSIDADGASYSNVRRYIQHENQLPPKNAVRTEELINYFNLDYEYSDASHPINLNGEICECPWNPSNRLIRIGIKGKPLPESELKNSNFVFLIDVSGSMSNEDKLELLKGGFINFLDELSENDRVAIVTYAGSAEVVLQSTSCDQKKKIRDAINSLGSGGSTAGAQGIITAYEIAQENFINNGNNRIIIGTDGDFNVGPSSQDELVELIEEKRELGIYITVLGVGRGNLNDAALEQIADKGNGTYEYIDNIEQLRKVFIYEKSKFFTVAKDVKVQVEFNPEMVESYRLIGYENRLLENEEFDDDSSDAGEIGANQNITALYEIVPKEQGGLAGLPSFKVDFRYKLPDSDVSIPMEMAIIDKGNTFAQASDFTKFTASIASFAMLLRDSDYKGNSSYKKVIEWLDNTNLEDSYNFKSEFKEVVKKARDM